ncbi:MAG: hypothetical protein ABIN69_10130 [Aestuariivirga sp.]
MSSLQQGFPESIDEIVSAVEETPRGRWFLQAYAERLRKGETASILASIEKLEASLKSMSLAGTDAQLIESTRAAISRARQEIHNLTPEISNLSPEGQLFAKLAEQSRLALGKQNDAPGLGKGVERALRLVADLEESFAGPVSTTQKPAAQSAGYFRQDEAIFEPAPTKSLAVVAETKPQNEQPGRGARLVIERVGEKSHQPNAAESGMDQRAADVFNAPTSPENEDRPRITIIRHEVEDLPEVPLPDMAAGHESSSAA